MIPYFDAEQIGRILDLGELADAMEKALVAFSAGELVQPVRMVFRDPLVGSSMSLMPVLSDIYAVKLSGSYPRNDELGLPRHGAIIAVFDRQTGQPRAFLDGTYLTQVRTAAASAAATRLLARADAKVLAIMGSGVQARGHFDALRLVRDFEDIRVWSRNPAHAEAFAAAIGARAMDIESAVRGADVICTVTPAREPVIQGKWLKRGVHINAVGWGGPEGRELDGEAMSGVVVVDSRDAVAVESGNIILANARVHAEIGEVLAGQIGVDPDENTVFVSVGIAAEDAFAASLVLRKLLPGQDRQRGIQAI